MSDIFKKLLDIGIDIVADSVPYGNTLVNVVRSITGADVPDNITGNDLSRIIAEAPQDQQIRIVESFNKLEATKDTNYKEMQETFAYTERFGKSERGRGVLILIWASVVWITSILGVMAYVSYKTQTFPDAWLVAAILGFPFTIIGAYYGVKSSEIKTILDVRSPLTGSVKGSGLLGMAGKLIGSKK